MAKWREEISEISEIQMGKVKAWFLTRMQIFLSPGDDWLRTVQDATKSGRNREKSEKSSKSRKITKTGNPNSLHGEWIAQSLFISVKREIFGQMRLEVMGMRRILVILQIAWIIDEQKTYEQSFKIQIRINKKIIFLRLKIIHKKKTSKYPSANSANCTFL